jgi:hypothetical protein
MQPDAMPKSEEVPVALSLPCNGARCLSPASGPIVLTLMNAPDYDGAGVKVHTGYLRNIML